MTETSRRRRFGSGTLDRVIIAAIVASIAVLAVGAYGILALGSHADVLPYRIAFTSMLNGAQIQENIFVLGRDGESKQVSTSPAKDVDPAWSPDGKRLVFARGGAVWVQDGDGTRQLSDAGAASSPKFSLDGTQIAYANAISRTPDLGHIWLMAADGANQHPISTSDDPNAKPPDCFGDFPAGWYPGTNRILYRGSFSDGSLAICSVNEDGTDAQTILPASDAKLNYSPALSPDGAWLAFSSDRDGQSHIYMIHPDGSGLTQLTFGAARDGSPAWAPNTP